MDSSRDKGRLTVAELAAIDLTITALQSAGHTIDAAKDDDPRAQMAAAVADAHHPVIELPERDLEIIEQIKTLASELTSRTSLRDLVDARGKAIQGE